MNVRCPQCQTVFRVDPEKIPPSGARARCARCGAKFPVQRPATSPDSRPSEPRSPAAAAPEPASFRSAPPAPSPPAPSRSPADAATVAASGGGAAVAQRQAHTAPATHAKDPNARAERLARALVSDIVAYHPERRDKSLSEGTLRTEFREEIMKSWEEYVAQVGITLAKSTPFFRDALNKILAKGQQVF
jgi:predicted Zn finger-like uncharacterized protein